MRMSELRKNAWGDVRVADVDQAALDAAVCCFLCEVCGRG